MTLASMRCPSPVGDLTLIASMRGLVAILWEGDDPGRVRIESAAERAGHAVLDDAAGELHAYFAGRRRVFSVPLDVRGTDFQKQVWAALRAIPFGETRSYADIALAIGRPTACRAVGAANGRNPLSIIMPCHRVVGSNGALTGFAGGLAVKARLLAMEQHILRTGAADGAAALPSDGRRAIGAREG
ncbi:MAG: methylated-DNA--[protein]-cysteine S-methyltransferase [Sphingobium sp.]